jgi:hypothetical protein
MSNDEWRMIVKRVYQIRPFLRHSDLFRHSDFVIRHCGYARRSIASRRLKYVASAASNGSLVLIRR